jgi:hypothetical protein
MTDRKRCRADVSPAALNLCLKLPLKDGLCQHFDKWLFLASSAFGAVF